MTDPGPVESRTPRGEGAPRGADVEHRPDTQAWRKACNLLGVAASLHRRYRTVGSDLTGIVLLAGLAVPILLMGLVLVTSAGARASVDWRKLSRNGEPTRESGARPDLVRNTRLAGAAMIVAAPLMMLIYALSDG